MVKRPKWGVNNYVKHTTKKRKGRHAKKPNKDSHKKRYKGQGR